jgi:Zn-finger nucleic acid-binding protein
MQPEALNCPNCGAAVSSDKTECIYCRTRLKTIACPRCLGLMFIGNTYCGHCGAKAIAAERNDRPDAGDCPRCRAKLTELAISDTRLRECTRCGGIWSDAETFENVCADRERQASVLGFIGERPKAERAAQKISYIPCPECGELMNRNNFARSSGVIIDVCKRHGVWFDAEEMPAVLEFIRKGGMELARANELNEIRDERRRLRDEQRKQAAVESRFGTGNVWAEGESSGIRGFVRQLFD